MNPYGQPNSPRRVRPTPLLIPSHGKPTTSSASAGKLGGPGCAIAVLGS